MLLNLFGKLFQKPDPINRFRRGDFEDILRNIGKELEGCQYTVSSSCDHSGLHITNKGTDLDKDILYTLTVIMSPKILSGDGCDMVLELALAYYDTESNCTKTKRLSKGIYRKDVDKFALSTGQLALVINSMLSSIDSCKLGDDADYEVGKLYLHLSGLLSSFTLS